MFLGWRSAFHQLCSQAMGGSKATYATLAAVQVGLLLAVACGGQAGSDRDSRNEMPRVVEPEPDAGPPDERPVVPTPPVRNDPPVADSTIYDDPGCPPQQPVVNEQRCNPFAEDTGCPPDQACYPYVIYPTGPCEVERYGSWCAPAGQGGQGDACSQGGCGAGFICVSTGGGTECVRLCALAGQANVCAPGVLCLPIDIEGVGGCL